MGVGVGEQAAAQVVLVAGQVAQAALAVLVREVVEVGGADAFLEGEGAALVPVAVEAGEDALFREEGAGEDVLFRLQEAVEEDA